MRDGQQHSQKAHVVQTDIIKQYILTSKSGRLPDPLLNRVQAALQLAAL